MGITVSQASSGRAAIRPVRQDLEGAGKQVWPAVLVAYPAHDEPCLQALVGAVIFDGVGNLGDLGVRDPLPGLLVEHRMRVGDGNPGALVDAGDGTGEFG